MLNYKPYKRSRRHSKRSFALLAVAALLVVEAGLELSNTTYFLHADKSKEKIVKTAGRPTKSPAENVSAAQRAPEKKPTSPSSTLGDGRVVDTHGQSNTTTPSSQWITSASGNITVKQPAANAKLQNSSVISGSAKVSDVHYRLIDNSTGVVAQGVLGVVGGNFSGNLQFNHQSSDGRLDIFSTEADGTEINEIQIAVVF